MGISASVFSRRKVCMSDSVQVALAGIGGYGDLYLESILHDPRASSIQLVGAVDPAPQRCRRLGELQARRVPVHSNLTTLYGRSHVDLMLIVTPIHLHCPQTCFALSRGSNVLCEKPLAGTMSDALKMVDATSNAKG